MLKQAYSTSRTIDLSLEITAKEETFEYFGLDYPIFYSLDYPRYISYNLLLRTCQYFNAQNMVILCVIKENLILEVKTWQLLL